MESHILICKALEIAIEKKGERLRVLDVSRGLAITDYFVMVSAQNRRQAQAIASGIDHEMKQAGRQKARIEGYEGGWWVLVDFDDIVVHVFQDEARAFYDLDQLWADAKDLTDEFLAQVTTPPTSSPSDGDVAGGRGEG
jgi:ribosome-associated protein